MEFKLSEDANGVKGSPFMRRELLVQGCDLASVGLIMLVFAINSASALAQSVDCAHFLSPIDTNQNADTFASSLSKIGDIDGDGLDDFIIGNPTRVIVKSCVSSVHE
ncbi:MAG: hypothetical protein HND57_08680 [Planctomycetes bacterium]|nr:hypothetical protein [Planctomycetota bacterium]